MIMRIRVDEPFTMPKELKNHIIKNLDILKIYFNKNIISADGIIHCTLNLSSISSDEQLQKLVLKLDKLMENYPFEAYHITNLFSPDKIIRSGIRLPAKITYGRRICQYLRKKNFNKNDIDKAYRLLTGDDYEYKLYYFMPENYDSINSQDYIYYGGRYALELLSDSFPNITEYLRNDNEVSLVKVVLRYSEFNDDDKIRFIIEIIKHVVYSVISDYHYPIKFEGFVTKNLTPRRIIDVKKSEPVLSL